MGLDSMVSAIPSKLCYSVIYEIHALQEQFWSPHGYPQLSHIALHNLVSVAESEDLSFLPIR